MRWAPAGLGRPDGCLRHRVGHLGVRRGRRRPARDGAVEAVRDEGEAGPAGGDRELRHVREPQEVGGKAARKAHAEASEATERALEGEAVHTVTPGRGKELSDAEGLPEALGAPACFCHPHYPWERGTNENTNGLLRD